MVRIGKIVATHGLQGAIILKHIAGSGNWLKKDDVLFIELRKESYIPHFVLQAKTANDEEYIVNVEDVDTVEAAKKLIGKQVYVKEDILAEAVTDSPLLWIGFNLVDVNKGTIGQIEDVVQAGPQWLAKLTIEGKEVLVPLVEQMLVDVNMRNKYIRIDLPEGLIDVYLQ
ncbi:ribosome maturation factor RimM [Polluticoccus soli]|uniref:ribosome maturation factor RimM n=1 Tax=Polluticoccus soli TaxID=3034150 RepID=UPI0023E107F3|nr:ribosome maturation factor RimM [Flavipsychrobacter sp. JY13-12]